jgi:WD40 repeat protein
VSAPVNCVCLHPNQAELVVGDQSGVIHLWDLKTDHNEQLVRHCMAIISGGMIQIDVVQDNFPPLLRSVTCTKFPSIATFMFLAQTGLPPAKLPNLLNQKMFSYQCCREKSNAQLMPTLFP